MLGKLFFAYVDPGVPFNPAVHNVEDEEIFNFTLSQSEGEFAQVEVEIINHGIGLLNVARKKRVYISIEKDGVPTLIFSGRIVGYPLNLGQHTMTVTILAQPEGWEETQSDFVQTLKVHPYYNELFVAEKDRNLDSEILSGYSSLIHWNRVSETISLSDILEGSKLIDLEDSILRDLDTNVGDPPLTGVDIGIEVQWQQQGAGIVDCDPQLRAGFPNSLTSPQLNTLTPAAFEKGWNGARIPKGYTVLEKSLIPVANGFSLGNGALKSDPITVSGSDYRTYHGAAPLTRQLTVPRVWYQGSLIMSAEYQQKRREVFYTTLEIDAQPLSLISDKYEELIIRLEDPTSVVNGEILSVKDPSFFVDVSDNSLTTYGQQAVEHGLMRARAILCKSTRNIETTFNCELESVLDIDCDTTTRIADNRFPGGSIRGKVISYQFRIADNVQIASVTMASSIGTGEDSSGSGFEVAEVTYENEFGPSEMVSKIFYEQEIEPDILVPVDVSQMESDNQYLIVEVRVQNDGETQNGNVVLQSRPDLYLKDNATRIEIELLSMNPSAELFGEVPIKTYKLTLPKHVNLEAS